MWDNLIKGTSSICSNFKILHLLLSLILICHFSFASSIISEHGYNIEKNGILQKGNITIEIYNESLVLIYNETFLNAIKNGSFGVQLGLSGNLNLNYGQRYYKDYTINGENLDFTLSNGSIVNILEFISNVGEIKKPAINESNFDLSLTLINWSYISNIPPDISNGDSDYCFGGSCTGDLIVTGNLTVFGSYTNVTIENRYINGSFTPELNNTFDLGNETNIWRTIYGNLTFSNFIIANQICIGSDCITSWPTGGGSSSNDTVWDITNSKYLINVSGILSVNENQLNQTIYSLASAFNETNLINTKTNSSGNWNNAGYNITASNVFANINASYILNAPWGIASITDTIWNIAGSNYLINVSGVLNVNETKLNSTINSLASAYNNTSLISSINASLFGNISALNNNISAINANISAINSNITSVWNNITSINSNITSLWNNLTSPTNAIISNISALNTSLINAINGNISALNTSLINAINTNISALNTSLVNAINSNASLKVNLSGNWNNAGYNITASNIFANINASYILNAPWGMGTGSQSSNDTWWNITGSNYLINNSNILYLNETKLNLTINTFAIAFNETSLILGINTTLQNNINNKIDANDQRYNETSIILNVNSSLWSNLTSINNSLWQNASNQEARINALSSNLSTNYYNKTSVYNKTEIYNKSETYTKTEIYNKTETYSKAEIYNKSEIDSKIVDYNATGYVVETNSIFNINETILNATIEARERDTWWTIITKWLFNNSGSLDFNETRLNTTIDTRASAFNETSLISGINTTLQNNINNKLDIADQKWNYTSQINTLNNSIINLNNSINNISSHIQLLNFTSLTYNGSITFGSLIGYKAANAICNNNYTGSFLCSEFDVADYVRYHNVSDNVDAWIISGGPKYIPAAVPADDCAGFVYDSTGEHVGNYWKYNNSNGGAGKVINCQTKIPLSCCR